MLSASDRKTGGERRLKITIFGLWLGHLGFAQHARQFAAALAKVEDVIAAPWDVSLTDQRFRDLASDDRIGVGIGSIDWMVHVSGRRRIGFVVWETTLLPREKRRILRKLDEIWVPSDWGRRVLLENGLPEDKVHVVPEGVDPFLFRPVSASEARPVEVGGSRPFRFLCVAKWEVRKGTADLALAFAREFRPDEPVELILHCSNPAYPGFDPSSALAGLNVPPNARIRTSKPMPLSRLPELYCACDVMVLPTKAEGWGLPILEALSCGIPVIATNYSAHTEFLTDDNGYLIDVAEMREVDDPVAFETNEPLGVWAQPDLHHLQALMRRSFENHTERLQKGSQARRDVLERWTWDHAAQIAQVRLGMP